MFAGWGFHRHWLRWSLKVFKFGNPTCSAEIGYTWSRWYCGEPGSETGVETGFWDIFASCILWSPAQFRVRTRLPGQILSFPVVLPLFSRMCEAADGGQPQQTLLKCRRQHLCTGLVEQRFCFAGMKSFPLPTIWYMLNIWYMKQVTNGCLMMSGGNCWKNGKIKILGKLFFSPPFFPHILPVSYFSYSLISIEVLLLSLLFTFPIVITFYCHSFQ